MPVTWIYAFSDSGYDRGIKVGRSSTKFGAWEDAPSYSPRPLCYVAGWEVELNVAANETKGAAAGKIEMMLHNKLGPKIEYPRSGREWFNLKPADAIEIINQAFGARPTIQNAHVGHAVTNDQFRNPHPNRLSDHPRKIVAWTYKEHLTGRIKTQIIDDWKTPFEIRCRYSRNGFDEIAAHSYAGTASVVGNQTVYAAWQSVMKNLARGYEDHRYGWMPEGVQAEAVMASYEQSQLNLLILNSKLPPIGVKAAYNRTE